MTNQKNKYHLVQIGTLGFPSGMAAIERVRLLSIGLIANEFDVTVISRRGILDKNSGINFETEGIHEGINYIFTSGSIYRPDNFIKRSWLKLIGFINEVRLLFRLRKENKLDFAILSDRSFIDLVYYKSMSLWLGFKLIYQFVELSTAMTSRQNLGYKINDYFFDKFGFNLVDGVLPISETLTVILKKMAPGKPYLKIPVICDFSKFEKNEFNKENINFLYCGTMAYIEVIFFILKCFESMKVRENVFLYLIVGGGSEPEKESIRNYIKEMEKRDFVKIFSSLPYLKLVQMYMSATALLIPLRPTMQDEARFPHKIGEYLASGNPLITTNIGEVKYYFKDKENALVAEEYNVKAFVEKMEYVLNNPQQSADIGLRGKQFGKENFDCMVYGKLLSSFVISLKNI